jgi:hypothetical protein
MKLARRARPSARLASKYRSASETRRRKMMDQPTAENALKELEPLVGEWRLTATPPGGPRWSGEGRTTFDWHDSRAHLVERATVHTPEAPDGVSIIGCDAANGTYYQLYSDDRGVCRVYEMSIGNGEWTLWRQGEPFPQRFTGRFEDDGNTIVGRWEKAEDGTHYTTDFDLTYTRIQ